MSHRRHPAVRPAPVRGPGDGLALRPRRARAEPRLRHPAHAQRRPRRRRHARRVRRLLGVHGSRACRRSSPRRPSPRSARSPGSRSIAGWCGGSSPAPARARPGSKATRCCSSSACRSSCRTPPRSPSRRTRAAYAYWTEVCHLGNVAMTGNRLAALVIAGTTCIAVATVLGRSLLGLVDARRDRAARGRDTSSASTSTGSRRSASRSASQARRWPARWSRCSSRSRPSPAFRSRSPPSSSSSSAASAISSPGSSQRCPARRTRDLRRRPDLGEHALGAALWRLRGCAAAVPARACFARRRGPREISARATRRWSCAGVVAAAALRRCPFFANPYLVATGLTLLMWLALTQSWCVLSKLTGYVSLGHVVFYGLGAYLVVVTWQSWPLPLAIAARGRARRAVRGADRPAGAARARARTS